MHADSYCRGAPKLPKGSTPHFDRWSSEIKREGSLQLSIYRHLQLGGYPKYLKETGR